MPRPHAGLPKAKTTTITKTDLFRLLKKLDEDTAGIQRVLKMETDFRKRISSHVESLPLEDAIFAKFNTNPFVLLIHTLKMKYEHVSQIEQDILPAKLFSSMETSAGRMVEQVVLPVYGWQYVPSEMHSPESVIDAKQKKGSSRFLVGEFPPLCPLKPYVFPRIRPFLRWEILSRFSDGKIQATSGPLPLPRFRPSTPSSRPLRRSLGRRDFL